MQSLSDKWEPMLEAVLEIVLEITIDILLALVPSRREHYVWYGAACTLILLSCWACTFIAGLAMQAQR